MGITPRIGFGALWAAAGAASRAAEAISPKLLRRVSVWVKVVPCSRLSSSAPCLATDRAAAQRARVSGVSLPRSYVRLRHAGGRLAWSIQLPHDCVCGKPARRTGTRDGEKHANKKFSKNADGCGGSSRFVGGARAGANPIRRYPDHGRYDL